MCVNCVTSFESVVFQGASAAAAVATVRSRLGWAPLSPAARRRQSDERTAEFLRQLGLDPHEYLVPAEARLASLR